MAEDYTKKRGDLASVLLNMSFGNLMEVATELVKMNTDDPDINRHPETPLGLAQTLYDWAEAEDQ